MILYLYIQNDVILIFYNEEIFLLKKFLKFNENLNLNFFLLKQNIINFQIILNVDTFLNNCLQQKCFSFWSKNFYYLKVNKQLEIYSLILLTKNRILII